MPERPKRPGIKAALLAASSHGYLPEGFIKQFRKETGLNPSTISQALAELKAGGHIRVPGARTILGSKDHKIAEAVLGKFKANGKLTLSDCKEIGKKCGASHGYVRELFNYMVISGVIQQPKSKGLLKH